MPHCVQDTFLNHWRLDTVQSFSEFVDTPKLTLRAFLLSHENGAYTLSGPIRPSDRYVVIAQVPKPNTELPAGSNVDIIVIDENMISIQVIGPKHIILAAAVVLAALVVGWFVGRRSRRGVS